MLVLCACVVVPGLRVVVVVVLCMCVICSTWIVDSLFLGFVFAILYCRCCVVCICCVVWFVVFVLLIVVLVYIYVLHC